MNDNILKTSGGVLVKPIEDPRDYVRGVSQITSAVNVSDGNWEQWLSTKDPQKLKFDLNCCTQKSAANACETQCNWLMANNKFSDEAIKFFKDNGYINQYGSFDFSDRFNAALDGTTIDGNFITSFWDSARKYGLLPKADFDMTLEESQQYQTQEAQDAAYYDKTKITQAIYDKALKSLSYIQIQYQREKVSDIPTALKQAPLHIAVPVNVSEWNNEYVPYYNSSVPDHATELYGQNSGYLIRDQYNPWNKRLDKSYNIVQCVMGVVSPISTSTPVLTPTESANISTELGLVQKIITLLTNFLNKLKA